MNKKYKSTEFGIEYIVYDEPIIMRTADAFSNYSEGGTLLYRAGKESDEMEVLAHVKYADGLAPVLVKKEISKIKDFEELRPFNMETFRPINKTELNLCNPIIMAESTYYSESNEYISYIVNVCRKVFDVKDNELRFYYQRDLENRGVIFFGYSVGELPKNYFDGYPLYVSSLTYEEYLQDRKEYKDKRKMELRRKAGRDARRYKIPVDEMMAKLEAEFDAGQIDFEISFEDDETISDMKKSLAKEMNVPQIALSIRKWLKKSSFGDFCDYITNRVKGQKEAELVAINIYNYLECVAYGKKQNNNLLVAAPSGCGKTETYRAIKDYFHEAVPGLVIYQLDMTSITEEGFKGKDTNYIISQLKEEDGGIGLVFLDEFDKKLIPSFSSSGSDVNLAVQTQILTLIEGRKVHESGIDTSNTMFIGMGAFDSCRAKKAVGEKHIGFGRENVKGQSHYANINREDMIDLGACYELIGRFSSIINYHELSPEIVDEIINGMVDKVSGDIGCNIKLSKEMRNKLHDNANGKYGCRIIESIIRENAMKGYLMLRKENRNVAKSILVLDDVDKVICKTKRAGKSSKSVDAVGKSDNEPTEAEAS